MFVRHAPVLAILLAGVFGENGFAGPGGLDPSFDYNGIVKTNFQKASSQPSGSDDLLVTPASSETLTAMALQADGKILAVGHRDRLRMLLTPSAPIYLENDPFDYVMSRYLPNGQLDNGFGINGRVTTDMGTLEDVACSVFALDEGRILVVGTCQDKIGLVRYLADGSLDPSFGTGGRAYVTIGGYRSSPFLPTLMQPDGKVLLAVSFEAPVNYIATVSLVLRINADGTLDETFGEQGRAYLRDAEGTNVGHSSTAAMTLLPNGSILLAGRRAYGTALTCLSSSGMPDPGLFANGVAKLDLLPITDMALQSDGKYVLTTASSYPDPGFVVARVNANGTLDQTFGTNSITRTTFDGREAYSSNVNIDGDGKIVVVGHASVYGRSEGMAVARYHPDGSLDQSFGDNGKVLSHITQPPTVPGTSPVSIETWDRPQDFLIQPDGKILVGGYTQTIFSNTAVDFLLARFLVDDSPSSTAYEPDVEADLVTDSAAVPEVNGRRQTRSIKPKRVRSRTISLTVRNLGTHLDYFQLRGTRGNSRLKMKYLDGDLDITKLVETGRYKTPLMSPEDTLSLTVRVAPARKFRPSSKHNFRLTATSVGNLRSTKVAAVTLSAGKFRRR